MEIADYRRMNTFELIDRINGTVTWADEEVEPCMRELCDRYHIEFNSYPDYEDLWDRITHDIYEDAYTHDNYEINDHDYSIISLDSDKDTEYAVINRLDYNVMFDVYSIGTMRECKNYLKEQIDND